MYEITILRRNKENRNEPISYVYYESEKEAIKNGIHYHASWRTAFKNREIKVGDYLLTEEELHVIPVIYISYNHKFPSLKTPNGSFNPKGKKRLTSRKFRNRHMFDETRKFPSGNTEKRNQSQTYRGIYLVRAAFHFARHGDQVAAYKFGYAGTPWLAKMSEKSIRHRANEMLNRMSFVRLYLKEVKEYLDEAGITPVDLLKNYNEKLQKVGEDPKQFEQYEKGTKFLLAMHPDFAEQMVPLIIGSRRSDYQLPARNNSEDVDYEEISDGEVEPGKHLAEKDNSKNDENKGSKTMDEVVSDSVSEEPVLEAEKGRNS